jgi:hypothetical protein
MKIKPFGQAIDPRCAQMVTARYRTHLLKAWLSYHEWHEFANFTKVSAKPSNIHIIRPFVRLVI